VTGVRQVFRARVKEVNPKGNFLLPSPQGESWFQEAVGGLGYCHEKRDHSSSEFYQSKVVKQQESIQPDILMQWLEYKYLLHILGLDGYLKNYLLPL
jgi:hypothetical protein